MADVIHAVSVQIGALATVCGRSIIGCVSTGWGREHQDVCAGITCDKCKSAMEWEKTGGH